MKYRAKLMRFLNRDRKTTTMIFTPQVKFDEGWCSFSDNTESGIIEHDDKKKALENAKVLYEQYKEKGQC